ncbi:MAG: hypothetical protein BroJett011_41740 [Chloroflexota bacterium]|nr:MAG: hypothetical protein BroJett011_41740 [Chloroflexota bacterium]
MLPAIVTQLSPSREQEPAINERGRDVVVTAGAGTGKTRTLVARYLALLHEELPLRSIVAITFTKKAAREMRNRLRDTIRLYLESSDLTDEHEQLRWGMHYSDLDAARVSTIHSLCTEILRAHPAEAGVDPRFEVLDEGQTNVLREQVVDEGLAWAANTPEIVSLFGLLSETNLRKTLSILLARRLEAEAIWAKLPADVYAHWQQKLADGQARARRELLVNESWLECVEIIQTNKADNSSDKLEFQRQIAVAAIDQITGSLTDLATINLKGGKAEFWPDGKTQMEKVRAALKTLRAIYEDKVLLSLTLTELDQALAQAMPHLRQLFTFACNRYHSLKHERQQLDFDDLEAKALALLRDHESVRRRWQAAVQALLVDEFQDTNARQRDLLDYLNGDQGKLFIVGDAKQSIYRFRNADVVVFREKRSQIEAQGGKHVPLDTSYRAHKALIDGMNNLLAPVLGTAQDPARPWIEPFSALKHDRLHAGQGFTPPHIELHLTIGSKENGALQKSAAMVVSRLVSLVEEQEIYVGVGPKAQPLDYGDIAILCRASRSFAPYEDALERAGIPFLTVAGRGFYQRPEIRDLLNALQALADPTNDLALAGLLRSPALALSDAALYQLRQVDGSVSLWQTLKQDQAELSFDDRQRANRAIDLIETLYQRVGRISVADLLKQFLDLTDYRTALIQAGQKRSARNVAKLLMDANTLNVVSVGEFLTYVNNLRDSGSREGEARSTAEGAIQLMTIHAAKGLEFPIVVIGDISHRGSTYRDALLDAELGVLLPQKDETKTLSGSYHLGKLSMEDQEQAESKRLLYVAITRAQEKVLLSGHIALNKDGKSAKPGGWLGELAKPELLRLTEISIQYDENGSNTFEIPLQVGQTPVGCYIYEADCGQKYSNRRIETKSEQSIPIPPHLLGPIDVAKARSNLEGPRRVWRVVPTTPHPHAPAWIIGNLVHKALAIWRFGGNGFDVWLAAQAHNFGLTDDEQVRHAVTQSSRLLQHFQQHPLYETMNQAAQRLHEVPYTLTIDGIIQSGIIDALYLQDGVWTVVEFKTDLVHDEAERVSILSNTDYLAQIQRYQQVVKQMVGQEPRTLLCWLNHAGDIYISK